MATILVVEDTPGNLALVTKLLTAAGHQVLAAGTGAEGIVAAQESRPDLVLMDLGLPDMAGWEALEQIKADPQHADLKVVAFTAHAMVGDRERALQSGFDGYLSKPIDVATFASDVAALVP